MYFYEGDIIKFHIYLVQTLFEEKNVSLFQKVKKTVLFKLTRTISYSTSKYFVTTTEILKLTSFTNVVEIVFDA